jgi:hypothetical protein
MPPKGKSGDEVKDALTGTSMDLGNRVTVFSKQLIILNNEKFYQWLKSLSNVIYSAKWSKDTIDITGELPDKWDGNEEADAVEASSKRDAYDVMRMRVTEKLQFMIDDIRPGDAREVFVRLSRRFTVMTMGAVNTLKTKVNSLTMENTNKNVEEFGYYVRTQFERLMMVTSRKDAFVRGDCDREMIAIFTAGLLNPEFDQPTAFLSMSSTVSAKTFTEQQQQQP